MENIKKLKELKHTLNNIENEYTTLQESYEYELSRGNWVVVERLEAEMASLEQEMAFIEDEISYLEE